MPYSAKQARLFQMIKHDKIKRKGLSAGKAAELLTHGVKRRGKVAKEIIK